MLLYYMYDTLWSMEFTYLIFKNTVPKFHKTQCIPIGKTEWLMNVKKIISV